MGSPQPSLLHPRSPQPHTRHPRAPKFQVSAPPSSPKPHLIPPCAQPAGSPHPSKTSCPLSGRRGDPQKVGTGPPHSQPTPGSPCPAVPPPLTLWRCLRWLGGGSTPSPGPSSGPGATQRGGHAPCAPHVPMPQRRGLGLALHGHRQQIPLIPPESSRRQAAGDPGGILRLGGPAASPPPPTASSCPPPPPRCACCAILGTGGHGNRRDGDGCHRESSSSIGDQQPELVGDGDGGVGGCCPPPRSTQPLAGCSAPI